MSSGSVTQLLEQLKTGDRSAMSQLIPLVYGELRRVADACLRREKAGHTLQPTALVHEAYLKLSDQHKLAYENRAHFLSVAACAMRRVLVDHARGRNASKRGSGAAKLSIEQAAECAQEQPAQLIALDAALSALEKHDAQQAQLVEMRFFGGLTAEESADVLQLPVETVRRKLRIAQAWLQREMDAS